MPLETQNVLAIFEEINRIPRCSGNTKAIAAWLRAWADERSLVNESDEWGNVLIRVPATKGLENAPVIVLQGHMDMVCEKLPESSHNFETDPIPLIVEGEWLHAEETTLGADNGIAIAMALALVESDLRHPPLEVLVTDDEEVGLTGAQNLAPGWLNGRKLLNLDSEDEGVFTVGCAGGRLTNFTLPVELEPAPDALAAREVVVSGLAGGHSGMDIHLGRASANQLLVRTLNALRAAAPDTIRVATMRGGNATNAIARDATAVIAFPKAMLADVETVVGRMESTFQTEYAGVETSIHLSLRSATTPESVLTKASEARICDFLSALPHGVIRMSSDVPGLVETSTNIAMLRLNNDTFEIATSQRSSYASRLAEVTGGLEALGRLTGASARGEHAYPPWEPHMESELLGRAVEAYKKTFGSDPVVEVIHAGLECGVIGAKYPGMEMISLGPTIQNPHSPDERLYLPSLEKACRFVEALLIAYADE